MDNIEIIKVSDTKFTKKVTRVVEETIIDLDVLKDQKNKLQQQKQVIVDDFNVRIAKIDAQIAEARNKGIKTQKEIDDAQIEVNR